jgi:hypothetical protein
MWNVAPVIFEDEDEEKLKADFVAYSARYPNFEPFEVGAYVFRNQRDAEMRAQQAVMIWLKDLEVQERIRLAKLNGGKEADPVETREQKLKKLEVIYNDPDVKTADRLKAMELHAQIQGEITKSVEKKVENSRPRRQIIFAQSND